MKADEIDKIIADAVQESKGRSKWHRPGRSGSKGVVAARRVINAVFMVGFVLTVIVYFVFPENKVLFFSLGFGSLILKVVEFFLRFMF